MTTEIRLIETAWPIGGQPHQHLTFVLSPNDRKRSGEVIDALLKSPKTPEVMQLMLDEGGVTVIFRNDDGDGPSTESGDSFDRIKRALDVINETIGSEYRIGPKSFWRADRYTGRVLPGCTSFQDLMSEPDFAPPYLGQSERAAFPTLEDLA